MHRHARVARHRLAARAPAHAADGQPRPRAGLAGRFRPRHPLRSESTTCTSTARPSSTARASCQATTAAPMRSSSSPTGGARSCDAVPEGKAADNIDETQVRVGLSANGSASIELTAKAAGPFTAELRRTFESPDERSRRRERAAFPDHVSGRQDHLGRGFGSARHRERVRREVPRHGDRIRLDLRERPAVLSLRPAPQLRRVVRAAFAARTSPAASVCAASLGGIRRSTCLPAGRAVVPENSRGVRAARALVAPVRQGRHQGDGEAHIELASGQLAPDQYASFRSFLSRLDAAVARRVEASPRPETASVGGGSPATAGR